ncbi:hypothetical protein [Arthrobacter sp. TMN-50]
MRNFISTDIESEGFDFDEDEADYVVDCDRKALGITRQTLCRHVFSTGELRSDGFKPP